MSFYERTKITPETKIYIFTKKHHSNSKVRMSTICSPYKPKFGEVVEKDTKFNVMR